MARAIIDPDEVRAFASELKKFNDELHSRMMSLYMRYKALGETWQDQEQIKFAEKRVELWEDRREIAAKSHCGKSRGRRDTYRG